MRPVLLWGDGLMVYLSAITRLDGSNPQVAARLLGGLSRWYTLAQAQKQTVHQALTAFVKTVHSKDVLEVAHKLLSADK